MTDSELRYDQAYLRSILQQTRTIAAVGVSPDPIRPSHYVGLYMSARGYTVIPVNPVKAGQQIFGQTTMASLRDIPESAGPVEMVDIFRRSEHAEAIVDEAIEALLPRGLRTIWMQFGVINHAAAAKAEAAGLNVVMDRCPKLEHQRFFGDLRKAGLNTGIISSKRPG